MDEYDDQDDDGSSFHGSFIGSFIGSFRGSVLTISTDGSTQYIEKIKAFQNKFNPPGQSKTIFFKRGKFKISITE